MRGSFSAATLITIVLLPFAFIYAVVSAIFPSLGALVFALLVGVGSLCTLYGAYLWFMVSPARPWRTGAPLAVVSGAQAGAWFAHGPVVFGVPMLVVAGLVGWAAYKTWTASRSEARDGDAR